MVINLLQKHNYAKAHKQYPGRPTEGTPRYLFN